MNRTEQIMRRKNVRAFIQADPIKLDIVRREAPTKNPNTGGFVANSSEPLRLSTQRARIVQNVRRYFDGLVNAEAGDIPNSEYRLIGMHTLDLKTSDEFQWLGEWYHVTGIHEARTESTFAAIELLGPENRG